MTRFKFAKKCLAGRVHDHSRTSRYHTLQDWVLKEKWISLTLRQLCGRVFTAELWSVGRDWADVTTVAVSTVLLGCKHKDTALSGQEVGWSGGRLWCYPTVFWSSWNNADMITNPALKYANTITDHRVASVISKCKYGCVSTRVTWHERQ